MVVADPQTQHLLLSARRCAVVRSLALALLFSRRRRGLRGG